jgi:predicted transcriptional regulator
MGVSYLERITIRLDDIEKELLQEYAEENDTTISQVIRRLIKEFLDEKYER